MADDRSAETFFWEVIRPYCDESTDSDDVADMVACLREWRASAKPRVVEVNREVPVTRYEDGSFVIHDMGQ